MKAQRAVPWLSTMLLAGVLCSGPVTGCADAPEGDVATITGPLCVVHSPTLFGIDVSKWQGNIDWTKVKGAGVKYAFIRVSDGITTIDAKFPANWAGALANGIPRGVYQFFRPNRDALEQAQIVIDHLALHGMGELPPVIDVEATGELAPAAVAAQVGIWIDEIESTLGVRPIIYSGSYFWDDNVNSSAYADYPFWIAHYTSAECPRLPADWSDWTFWQYSSTGSVSGIAGNVDMNRYAGTEAELLGLVPAEVCRLDPGWRDCGDDIASVCVDGQIETTACGPGSSCVGVLCFNDLPDDPPEPQPEVVEAGPEVVEVVESQPEVVEAAPEVVEAAPEVSDTSVSDTSGSDTAVSDTGDSDDTFVPVPDTVLDSVSTRPATPSRSVSGRAITPSGGCAGGGAGASLVLGGLAALLLVRRRTVR